MSAREDQARAGTGQQGLSDEGARHFMARVDGPRLVFAALLMLGAVAFTAAFDWHLRGVAPSQYTDRDDAVITLSHARNLVEYGFIGVSPSGERVEGYSAPLQFFTAAAIYAVVPFDYQTFFLWQSRIGTVALGALFAALLASSTDVEKFKTRAAFIVLAVILSAQLLASSTAFLWWHASGMENAYKCVALIALLWALDVMLRRGRISWKVVVLIPIAATTRIDAVVPVAALLSTFVLLWLIRHRDVRAPAFAMVGLGLWALVMIWRYWYFGQWAPNTAAAQGISVASRLLSAARAPLQALEDYQTWFAQVGPPLFAFQLLWLFPLVWLVRRQPVAINRAALITSGAFACVLQYALFGPARMDLVRTVTELALYATAAIPFVLLGITQFQPVHVAVGALVMVSSVAITAYEHPHTKEIGWGTPVFEQVADQFDLIAKTHDIPRALVANPDLGAVSWRKHFNMLDLGRLGSVMIPRAASPSRYTAEVVLPDIIELHAPWSCSYRDLFQSAAFSESYTRLTPPDPGNAFCAGSTGNAPAFWIRKDIMRTSPSTERAFLDRFRATLDVSLIEQELPTCVASPGPRPCGYVGRTLFRFAPELRESGRGAAIERLLDGDPRLRIERAFFVSSNEPRWWQEIEHGKKGD